MATQFSIHNIGKITVKHDYIVPDEWREPYWVTELTIQQDPYEYEKHQRVQNHTIVLFGKPNAEQLEIVTIDNEEVF